MVIAAALEIFKNVVCVNLHCNGTAAIVTATTEGCQSNRLV